MIKNSDNLTPALLALRSLLGELRYDWLYRSFKGTSYFIDPLPAGIPPAVLELLATVGDSPRTAFQLFCLGAAITVEQAHTLLPGTLTDDLVATGLLTIVDNSVRTDDYIITPWLGNYIIHNINRERAGGWLRTEQFLLGYELMNGSGQCALALNCGCGATALIAAQRAATTIARADDEHSLALTRANIALNDLGARVRVEAASTSPLPDCDWVFATEEFPHGSEARLMERLALMPAGGRLQIWAQASGDSAGPALIESLRTARALAHAETTLMLLSRQYTSADYYSYTIYIDAVAAGRSGFELIDLTDNLTARDEIVLPEGIEIIAREHLVMSTRVGDMVIDEAQQTIVDQLGEGKLLIREIAEIVAARHHLPMETAAAKTLEFCHQLQSLGLLEAISLAKLRGQMRLMQVNVNRFANTLQTLGGSMDNHRDTETGGND